MEQQKEIKKKQNNVKVDLLITAILTLSEL